MAKKSKRTEGTPRLIRRLSDLQKDKRRGLPTSGLEQSISELLEDTDEVTRAFLWLGEFDRLACLAAFRKQVPLELVREAQRPDLTKSEAIALLKEFREIDQQMEAAATAAIERKWQKRFHPWS